jgi:hypothetical protein
MLLRSFPTSEISLPFSIFPNYFLPFFSLFYTYPCFSLFLFSLLLSLSRSILSHFFFRTWVPGLSDLQILISIIPSHHEFDRPSCYPILSQFFNRRFRVGGVELSYPMFCDIHFASKTFCDLHFDPQTPRTSKSHSSYDESIRPPCYPILSQF